MCSSRTTHRRSGRQPTLLTCLVVPAIWLVPVSAAAADALDDAVAAIRGVGSMNSSRSTLPEDKERLTLILTASDERVDQWLAGTSRQKSAAIMVLSSRGEVNRLASLSFLLADEAPAIAGDGRWALAPDDETLFYSQRSLRLQLSHTLEYWLGRGCGTPEKFARHFAGVTDFNTLATPWVRRLERAAESTDPSLLASIKQQVAALNPDIRWVVIAEASNAKLYNDNPPIPVAEARSMMQALPSAKKAALAGNDPVVPPDPKYQGESSAELAYTRTLAKELLAASP